MSAQPLVSICIPTYKGGAYLAAAIDSVLSQTLTDFELVVVDDNSPDDTADIVAGFDDARLVYERNPANLGPQGNWNRCLQLARGRYFKLLPHDDLLMPACLEQQVAILEADARHELALVFGARDVIGPDGRVLTSRHYGSAGSQRLTAQAVRAQCARRGTNVLGEPGSVMFRRELARRIGPFDARHPYVIDMDYWLRLLDHGDAYYCDQILSAFRVSREQWSVRLGQQQADDFRQCMRQHLDRTGSRLHPLDRGIGWVTPVLNNWGRRLFYRFYL
ncbi:glycosyltransferase family 2 protein [Roseateles sp.]|uniref:glycosyltransferase family 2 protein n=1 Tax=Roseateles sp. TaxID=1971397 RepID=UPI003BAD0942